MESSHYQITATQFSVTKPPTVYGLTLVLTVTAVVLLLSSSASAELISYTLEDGNRVPAPLSYVFDHELSDLGLSAPTSIFINAEGNILIADTGKNRVIEVSRSGELLFDYSAVTRLSKPEGVFAATDGTVYVADTGSGRVLVFDKLGNLVREYPPFTTEDLGASTFAYQPTRIVVDHTGLIYVISHNDYRGMIRIDPSGRFRGFFADNRVPFSLKRIFTRLFASEVQWERVV